MKMTEPTTVAAVASALGSFIRTRMMTLERRQDEAICRGKELSSCPFRRPAVVTVGSAGLLLLFFLFFIRLPYLFAQQGNL